MEKKEICEKYEKENVKKLNKNRKQLESKGNRTSVSENTKF